MAVEKMNMVQIVAKLEDLDRMVRIIFNTAPIQLVDAREQIENYSFTIGSGKENLKKTVDMNHVSAFDREDVWTSELNKWPEVIGEKPDMGRGQIREQEELLSGEEIEEIFKSFEELNRQIRDIDDRIHDLKSQARSLKLFSASDVNLSDLSEFVNFSYSYGSLTESARRTIRGNYENIPAAILHLGQIKGEEAYFMLYPKSLDQEIQRLKASLNWKKLEMPSLTDKTNEERQEEISSQLVKLREEKEKLQIKLESDKEEKADLLYKLYESILDRKHIEEAKSYMTKGQKYFYLTGWLAANRVRDLKKNLEKFEDCLIKVLQDDQVALEAPTKLKNIGIFKPFEMLVNMYGIPNYKEFDPTPFFAISYMILFGSMFGDLGQGAIFALAGLFFMSKGKKDIGGIALSVGISSMTFGLLYGSVFGNEDLLPAILIKPFDNINKVLIASIAFGVILSGLSFIIGISNKIKERDIEEGLFGKSGLVGFVLYLSLIFAVLAGLKYINLPVNLFLIIIVICLILLFFKQPIANALLKKDRLYDEEASSYYVESAFSLIEAMISVFSGLVSFIRVGAFAINHVGLFMAFVTMGQMMGGSGQVLMLILGNILIIGLEGLIVFIQSLRLEYYEMFSKYYRGDGHAFTQTNRTDY